MLRCTGEGYEVKRGGLNWRMWVGLASIVLVTMIILGLLDIVGPTDMTRTRLLILEGRIIQFVNVQGYLPKSLDELPPQQNKDNSIVDGWNRPIRYTLRGEAVVLSSYGADGVPGGEGKNADYVREFSVSETHGSLRR